jgi:magnesium-protoporphyrin O-methyltransferase
MCSSTTPSRRPRPWCSSPGRDGRTRLIVSFAPFTPLLALLKQIGQLFPGPSKTTRAYTLREYGIVTAAAAAGFRPVHRILNQAPFYFSRLIAFERG